jgi:DNA-binding MurR/RpiR family transcriptional regulator
VVAASRCVRRPRRPCLDSGPHRAVDAHQHPHADDNGKTAEKRAPAAGRSGGHAAPVLTYLQGIIASLNPTERLIADCVLSDPERVISSSIAQINERCGASVGAIVGFCRRLGLKGFAVDRRDTAQEGDVALGISLSGSTQETVQCMAVAQGKGATTICLTNAMKSPITAHSELALYATPSEVKYFQAPLASRITQLALIDALFVSLALKHGKRTAGRLQLSGEELLKRRLE